MVLAAKDDALPMSAHTDVTDSRPAEHSQIPAAAHTGAAPQPTAQGGAVSEKPKEPEPEPTVSVK